MLKRSEIIAETDADAYKGEPVPDVLNSVNRTIRLLTKFRDSGIMSRDHSEILDELEVVRGGIVCRIYYTIEYTERDWSDSDGGNLRDYAGDRSYVEGCTYAEVFDKLIDIYFKYQIFKDEEGRKVDKDETHAIYVQNPVWVIATPDIDTNAEVRKLLRAQERINEIQAVLDEEEKSKQALIEQRDLAEYKRLYAKFGNLTETPRKQEES